MTKPKPKSEHLPAGRPTAVTPDVIRKIEEVAALDGSVEEMAYYAGVHKQTIYTYFKNNPTFLDHVNDLRQRPILKARQTVVRSLENPDHAFKYLERKRKQEFSPRIEQDITTGGEPLENGHDIKELSQKFDEFFKKENS